MVVTLIQDHDGEDWWVLFEICNALGLKNTNQIAANIPPDDKKLMRVEDTAGRVRRMYVVNEIAVFNLIDERFNGEEKTKMFKKCETILKW